MSIILGTEGDDDLIGTPDDETFVGSAGDDRLRGNGGFDILDYSALGTAITLGTGGRIVKDGLVTTRSGTSTSRRARSRPSRG